MLLGLFPHLVDRRGLTRGPSHRCRSLASSRLLTRLGKELRNEVNPPRIDEEVHPAMSELPLANMITLGVRDIGVERGFYRKLGWPQVFESEEFDVFELQGAVLALFPVEKLAVDARTQPGVYRGGIRCSVIINVAAPDEVDALVARARLAGATVTKDPVDAEFFTGRDAYFSDPEGHFWEVAYAPSDNPIVAVVRRAAGLAT